MIIAFQRHGAHALLFAFVDVVVNGESRRLCAKLAAASRFLRPHPLG